LGHSTAGEIVIECAWIYTKVPVLKKPNPVCVLGVLIAAEAIVIYKSIKEFKCQRRRLTPTESKQKVNTQKPEIPTPGNPGSNNEPKMPDEILEDSKTVKAPDTPGSDFVDGGAVSM